VWLLVQTMTGGSSVLPPVQFPPATTTQFIVGLTDTEWLQVFSSLMAGADLLYPDTAHEVVWALLKNVEFPLPELGYGFSSRVDLWSRDAIIGSGGAMAFTNVTTAWYNGYWHQNPGGINSRHDFFTYLTDGTWQGRIDYRKTANSGIATITARPDTGSNVAVAAVDFYNATTQENQFSQFGFTIPVPGRYIISVEPLTKNPSSSAYLLDYSLIALYKTS